MKVSLVSLLVLSATPWSTAFSPHSMERTSFVLHSSTAEETKIEHSHCQEPGDRDILVRAARGEITERTPVWLCRQAGRYMAAFRGYSTKYAFRQRSETPEMATELSLQCHRKYGMDGIIMFSDILTPLPTLGIDFDVVAGVGPVISTKVESEADVERMGDAESIDFDETLPFIREILGTLSKEAEEANTSLIGFVGAPFTLAAYTIEGKSSKHCLTTKKHMMRDLAGDDKTMSLFLDKLAIMIGNYACHQIDCGAQVIQLFESWAHQITPAYFAQFAKPAAMKAIQIIKAKHPMSPSSTLPTVDRLTSSSKETWEPI
jgi:uroporphyrinogen decarboxylase